jgi:hypothetical protein
MRLTEVTTPAHSLAFIKVNVEINKTNPHYIRPLDKDVLEIFDEKKNKAFRQGGCIRWILQDNAGKLIGRIAAFTNKKYKNKGDEVPVGGIGFFDCIHDQRAAGLLFDTAKQWLEEQGMEAMDGPINFGERDRWWGLLVEGFQEPLYCMNYNYPYYQELFENYGFRNFYNQHCFGLDTSKKLSPKMYERHAIIEKEPGYKALHIDKSRLEKFAADFTIIYNKAWAGHGGLKELKKEQVLIMFKKMKPVMDERVVWFAYHHDEPVCMFINLPDINQYFKHLNGQFGLLQKLYFLWLQKTMKKTKFIGIVYGIAPAFQGMGVDAFMLVEAAKLVQPHTDYREFEMQWIGEFNPKMINVAKSLGDTFPSRRLTTYRYLFDRNREFKRHPVIG